MKQRKACSLGDDLVEHSSGLYSTMKPSMVLLASAPHLMASEPTLPSVSGRIDSPKYPNSSSLAITWRLDSSSNTPHITEQNLYTKA